MNPAAAPISPEIPFGDDDWEVLLEAIEQQSVVPVVGPELLIRGNDRGESLHPYLVDQLSKPPFGAHDLLQGATLMDICSYHSSNRRRVAEKIVALMKGWEAPEPLKQLAEIEALDLYVSVTYDSLLFQALQQARVSAQSVVVGTKRQTTDIASDRDFPPTVFQVFGVLDSYQDCALTEEDLLRISQRLANPSYRPKNLFDLLEKRNLLFLGCDFPGWLGRMTRQLLKGSELQDNGLFAHPKALYDPTYVMFLERQGAKIWVSGSAVDFVDQLHRRWRVRHPSKEADQVFISYAREDLDIAELLSSKLRSAGITVWFDKGRLNAGDDWSDEIAQGIRGCTVFIPLNSRHSNRTDSRYCRKEWELGLGMPGKRIAPLLVDDEPLASELLKHHAEPRADMDKLVQDIRTYLNNMRRSATP